MRIDRVARAAAALALVAMVAAACGNDDGADVRAIGSGSGSASGSGSNSGVGSGTTAGFGGYTPVSDVTSHAKVSLDVCAISEAMPADGAADWDTVQAVYAQGKSSVKGDGSKRTLKGFATEERDERIWNDYVARFGSPTWLDGYVSAAIAGTGPFAGEPDAVRRQGVQKGVQNQILVAWAIHELVAAEEKAAKGETDPASGAPHAVDEAWAFYHGESSGCAPYATANSRGENFGKGTAVNDAILAQMKKALEAAKAGKAADIRAATDEIVRQMTITYVQAAIRYSSKMSASVEAGNTQEARVNQAEGWTYWRVIEPLVAKADKAAADAVTKVFDLSSRPAADAGATVKAALEGAYAELKITADEVGTLQG